MATTKRTATPTVTISAQQKAYETWKAKMDKSYGVDTFKQPTITPYRVIPTGSLDLDAKLVIGGWPRARVTELWGPEGSGKTLLTIWASREAQRIEPGKRVGFIDVEQRWDSRWARLQGLDLSMTELVTPKDAEDVADMVKDMARSGMFSLIVVDSIGAMISKKEIEKNAEDVTVGIQSKLVTRMVKIAAPAAVETDTTFLFINQVRANVAGMGNPMTTGGGWALKHASTIKARTSRGEPIKVRVDGQEVPVGYKHKVNIERNSMAPHGRFAEVVIYNQPTSQYGPVGLDRADEAATVGIRTGVIHQTGGYYTFTSTGEKVQGRDAVVETLRGDLDLIADVRERVLATLSNEAYTEEEVLLEADDEETPLSIAAAAMAEASGGD